MTKKEKQARKTLIANRAAALKKGKEEINESVREAEALEAAGRWAEASIAWGVVADCAGAAAKKKAAGRRAAAKVRAEAEEQRLEDEAGEMAEAEAAEQADDGSDDQDDTEPADELEDAPEAEGRTETKTPAAPRERDPRLPPVGTVLTKTDRNGAERVRCTIVENGIEYAGATYKTLSAAGLKAMADLGLGAKTCDGFAFWGLKKGEARPAKAVDHEALKKHAERILAMAARGMETTDADLRTRAKARIAWLIEALQRAITPATDK